MTNDKYSYKTVKRRTQEKRNHKRNRPYRLKIQR